MFLAALGQKEQALERYRQMVEIDQNFSEAWSNLGTLLCSMDRRQEACDAYREALRADPANVRALYNLADTLDELG